MREIKNPLPVFRFYAHGFCAWRDARRVFLLCGGWVCTLKTSYPFTKHIPVVIVMSVSHVSRYAMSWMGIGAAESHRQKNWFAAVLSPFRERKIPGYNYQFATDKAITGSRDNDTPVQSQVER